MTHSKSVFLELVKAGLFPVYGEGIMVNESFLNNVDWNEVYRLAEEQSVIGLVTAGIDRLKVNDSQFMIPQAVALQFIGQTLQIEQRNNAMNGFIAGIVEMMQKVYIYFACERTRNCPML